MIYQTDFEAGYPQRLYLYRHGCLLCSLVRSVEQLVSCDLSVQHFLQLVDKLHFELKSGLNQSYPVLSDEDDIKKEGAFVWDHKGVLNATAEMLGSTLRFKYRGCVWLPKYESDKRKSWGHDDGDFLIINTQTPNTGHFRLMDWDPWKPGTTTLNIRSVRFYGVL